MKRGTFECFSCDISIEFRINIILFVSAELKMDVLREREVKDNLERQLVDEQKMRREFYYYISYLYTRYNANDLMYSMSAYLSLLYVCNYSH